MPKSDFYLSEVSSKDRVWDSHRSWADQVRDLYEGTELSKYGSRIDNCSQLLEFAFTVSDSAEVKLRLHRASFCRVRTCPVCQWRRSLMWKGRFLRISPQLLADYPSARYLSLTLTLKNCELTQLRSTINQMNLAWRRLSQRKNFPAIGWVRATEVTRGEDGSAHPHFHALLMVNPSYFKGQNYLSHEKWVELWRQCLKVDYLPSVRVKVIRPKNTNDLNPQSALQAALVETLKYGVKESDLAADPVWLTELTYQLLNTRAISLGGILKQYLSEDEPEDLIAEVGEVADSSDPLVRFSWKELVKRYAKTA